MRLAMADGRLAQWESFLDELTPHQLRVIEVFFKLEPWGRRIDDLRAATMTATIVGALNGAQLDPNQLALYLKSDHPHANATASPNAVAASMRQKLARTIT
jgi:hypothetical protein